MSGGFFGFDSSLPERRAPDPSSARQAFSGFQQSNTDQTFALSGAGEEEDLAVYTWGEGNGASLLEGGDDLNDETFGDLGEISNNFQFSSQSAPLSSRPAHSYATRQQTQPRGPIASTASRYKPKPAYDPFAASEDDFYASRPTTKKPTKPQTKTKAATDAVPAASLESLWQQPKQPPKPTHQPAKMWGAAGSSVTKPLVAPPGQAAPSGPPPVGEIKSLEEIEAEMARVAVAQPEPVKENKPKVLTLEEIEQHMMASTPDPAPESAPPVPRETTPLQSAALEGSGYAYQQALLDSMFPELGTSVAPGSKTASMPQDGTDERPRPSPEELARLQDLQERLKDKIQSMSHYNNVMGSSDKDFITRIQLSQLATADPYASDFYAQVFMALKRSRMVAEEGPTVVQITSSAGLGVGFPTGNRFGKMGSATMQKLSTQVKKLVENRQQHQKSMGTAALQGALGKVTRGNAAAPRPVLAVPTASRPENRPVNSLNQLSGPRRKPLPQKQVMFALEELYDSVLELEQMRREMPPPTAMDEIERWNAACAAKVEMIWRRLMVMEPLDISTPHPFISLMNPAKGRKLFPRLLRHLPHQQALTLLTLLIATYPQLDVVARAPPPPVADASLLTKADGLNRVRREAETDDFLHCVIPGADMLINRCNLGLLAGLLGICAQRMEVWKVASTRPGVALFTALLSKAQGLIRAPAPDPMNPQKSQAPEPAETDQWNKTFAYFLQLILPHLPELFPSTVAQKAAFGPGAYLLGGDPDKEREGVEMERREAEVWGLAAALAVNAPEEEQTNLVGALREKILHTVQAARNPSTTPARAEIKLRNVNMFLNGLGLDASMIE